MISIKQGRPADGMKNDLILHHSDCVGDDCECHLFVNQSTGVRANSKPSFLFSVADKAMPVHPQELGIIDITIDDLYAFADAMEAYNAKKAQFVPLAVVPKDLPFTPFSELPRERIRATAAK